MSKFKPGDVCIWQNQVGDWAWLNGKETTVTGQFQEFFDVETRTIREGYATDTFYAPKGVFLAGEKFDLRLKPGRTTGEELIRTMFDKLLQPELVPA